MLWPAYQNLTPAELDERAERAIALLEDCRACPRDCGVNRLMDRYAACKTGRYAVVNSHFPHFGEEDCLRGWRGSGTIFFSHCNLRCVFCQNFDISQAIKPPLPGERANRRTAGIAPKVLSGYMLELQGLGCHNINFVTPEHVVPQIVEALPTAIRHGLNLPIVYNTSAYDSLESLEIMDGLVDIYMPDFKYWTSHASRVYLKAENYPEFARKAIKEMHRQVGDLTFDADRIARRGLLIRHLVMPGGLDETEAILRWIVEELGPNTYVNLMDQYYPAGRVTDPKTVDKYRNINRRLSPREFADARDIARDVGLRRLDERRPHPRLGNGIFARMT